MGRLLEFLDVALGAVVVRVGAMDEYDRSVGWSVCVWWVVLVPANSIANGWVGGVAEAKGMGVVIAELGGAS